MNHLYKIILIPILFAHICANRKPEARSMEDGHAASMAVEADWRRIACERGLIELKAQLPPQGAKTPPVPNVNAVRASDAVHQ